MRTDFIPFQIGMQYEDWEFVLEPVEFARHYDKYRYIKGDMPEVLGVEVAHIHLYFRLDILFRVEVEFNTAEPLDSFTALRRALQAIYGVQHLWEGNPSSMLKMTWNSPKVELGLCYNFGQNKVSLEVSNISFTNRR